MHTANRSRRREGIRGVALVAASALDRIGDGAAWSRRAIDTSPDGASFGWVDDGGPVVSGAITVAPRSLVALVAEP
jgi:hypothetical protein